VVAPGDVRLLGDTADTTGAVEYYDGILGWTGVCADSAHYEAWANGRAALIVCSQLGFEGGLAFARSTESLEELAVARLDCSERALSLDDCERETLLFSGGCASQEAGWVECRETGETPPLSLPLSLSLSVRRSVCLSISLSLSSVSRSVSQSLSVLGQSVS
jgi:hypothetical protein